MQKGYLSLNINLRNDTKMTIFLGVILYMYIENILPLLNTNVLKIQISPLQT